MKKWMCLHLNLCGLCLLTFNIARGQSVAIDSTGKSAAVNYANALYAKAIGQQLPLNNGPEYYFYDPAEVRGSAYFMEMPHTPGSVYYDGEKYTGVRLLYDIYKDELATIDNQSASYVLLPGLVQNFDLLGHHFININTDTLANNNVIKNGYYDELYSGRSAVLTKRKKEIQNYTSSVGELAAYSFFTTTKEEFFIRKDKVYYKVSSQGDVLDILKDRKSQLKQYIKANKIKYNKNTGTALASILAYYDQITS
jgi:hypothetical protein